MPLVTLREILQEAKKKRYGVLSLLGGNLEMVIGSVRAAEEKRAPLILVFNQEVTPQVPMEMGVPLIVHAAKRAEVPVATILDHGETLEAIVKAIRLGTSSVMYDGSRLPYEENVRRTKQIVRIAHAVGVSVEAELGSIGGSAVDPKDSGPESSFTDPDVAADFVARTRVDALAISFGNVHGLYKGEPRLDLDRVRKIHSAVEIPLVMHGASGLTESDYKRVIESGISKICYYTAMGIGASNDLRRMMAEAGQDAVVYHALISRSINFFCTEAKKLMDIMGCSGVARLSERGRSLHW